MQKIVRNKQPNKYRGQEAVTQKLRGFRYTFDPAAAAVSPTRYCLGLPPGCRAGPAPLGVAAAPGTAAARPRRGRCSPGGGPDGRTRGPRPPAAASPAAELSLPGSLSYLKLHNAKHHLDKANSPRGAKSIVQCPQPASPSAVLSSERLFI